MQCIGPEGAHAVADAVLLVHLTVMDCPTRRCPGIRVRRRGKDGRRWCITPTLSRLQCSTGDVRRFAAAAGTAAILAAGCSEPARDEGRALRWRPCAAPSSSGPTAQVLASLDVTCATVLVPVDHDRKETGTYTIHLIRLHKRSGGSTEAARAPVLTLAGGPGGSGVDYAPVAAELWPPEILDRFDLVGFDQRGVGRSGQIRCAHSSPKRGPVPLPDFESDAGFAAVVAQARHGVQECIDSLGERASSYSTTAAAHDIDRIRAALRQDRLTLVGGSYGAKLGAEYVRLYPERMRAAVLDAPSDPTATWFESIERQVAGFESRLAEFGRWCTTQPRCAAIGDAAAAVRRLADRADAAPIPSFRPGDDEASTGWDVLSAVVSAMYDMRRWPDLVEGIKEARRGDTGTLRELADTSVPTGSYGDANFVINCDDSPDRAPEAEIRAAGKRLAERYPTFGRWGGWPLFGCTYWDVPRHSLTPPRAATVNPLLVIGTLRDPATPYRGAQVVAEGFGNARLLTVDGGDHAAFGRSACVGEHVAAYLVDLTLPPPGTRCPA